LGERRQRAGLRADVADHDLAGVASGAGPAAAGAGAGVRGLLAPGQREAQGTAHRPAKQGPSIDTDVFATHPDPGTARRSRVSTGFRSRRCSTVFPAWEVEACTWLCNRRSLQQCFAANAALDGSAPHGARSSRSTQFVTLPCGLFSREAAMTVS